MACFCLNPMMLWVLNRYKIKLSNSILNLYDLIIIVMKLPKIYMKYNVIPRGEVIYYYRLK